jgi:hypothetical protein
MVRETPAILAAEMMESGGLSWGNASFTSIFQPLCKPKGGNLPRADKRCEAHGPMHKSHDSQTYSDYVLILQAAMMH